MFGWVLLLVGSFICVLNFYLSVLRYPLHRMRGRNPESYRWVSGIPLVGSIAVVAAWTFWMRDQHSRALDIAALAAALLDTGGIHWFVATMIYRRVADHGARGA